MKFSRRYLLMGWIIAVVVCAGAMIVRAVEAPVPTLEQRVADVEAYINNTAPGANTKVAGPGPGHNAWMMTSTALVLFMTLPGLALFYGGLVRRKNVLATIMHSFFILCLISVQWVLWGYSLAFGPDHGGLIGGLDFLALRGVGQPPTPQTQCATGS